MSCNGNCNQGRTCKCTSTCSSSPVANDKPVSAIPLCQDCEYYDLNDYEDFCLHEKSVISINPVNGHKSYRTCIMMRTTSSLTSNQCGHSGLLFKPAETKTPSIIQFFKNLF